MIHGDLEANGALISADDYNVFRGQANDGDDIIDIGDDNSIANKIHVYGQGGNDKIIGSIGSDDTMMMPGEERLSGGDGDDKIWAHNPGQFEDDGLNLLSGNNGNDILYGSAGNDMLYGDWAPSPWNMPLAYGDLEGGNDIIYTGEATTTGLTSSTRADGGWGDDKIYGQGVG